MSFQFDTQCTWNMSWQTISLLFVCYCWGRKQRWLWTKLIFYYENSTILSNVNNISGLILTDIQINRRKDDLFFISIHMFLYKLSYERKYFTIWSFDLDAYGESEAPPSAVVTAHSWDGAGQQWWRGCKGTRLRCVAGSGFRSNIWRAVLGHNSSSRRRSGLNTVVVKVLMGDKTVLSVYYKYEEHTQHTRIPRYVEGQRNCLIAARSRQVSCRVTQSWSSSCNHKNCEHDFPFVVETSSTF